MKKKLISILSFILIIALQIVNAESNGENKNSFSFDLGITDLLKLNGYNGTILSIKYLFNQNNGMQLGISGYNKSSTEDGVQYASNATIYGTGEIEEKTVSGYLGYLHYFNVFRPIKIYTSIGITGYYYNKESTTNSHWYYTAGGEEIYPNYAKEKQYSYGGRIKVGLEWHFADYFSFFIDYGLNTGLLNKDYETSNNPLSPNTSNISVFFVEPTDILLGLSIDVH